MSDNILQLYPRKPTAAPEDVVVLARGLERIGLISTPFDDLDTVHYRPGSQFHKLIRFSRSHTVILLEPQAGQLVEAGRRNSAELCHIGLREVTPTAEFLGMGNTRTPRCPHCKHAVGNWQEAMDSWYADKPGYRWGCLHCEQEYSPVDWDWQKTAAIARFTIEIWGIHEGEARPTKQLLEFLATQVASPWDYFYYRC
jgi:hypothetical protein